jgi:GNAT superfamily N-acetyltransferase
MEKQTYAGTIDFRVTPLTSRYLDDAVQLHLCAFPDFFLSFLGPRFLREFYASFLVDPMGIGFVATDYNDRLLGVVVGPLVPAGYFSRLLRRRWWAFGIASITAVIKKPIVISRLFRAVFYRGEAPSGPVRALLSSIAVKPVVHGGGVGKALVRAWTNEVRTRGGTGCFLTTDALDNGSVNAFYCKLGWRIASSYSTREGRRMNQYIYDIEHT